MSPTIWKPGQSPEIIEEKSQYDIRRMRFDLSRLSALETIRFVTMMQDVNWSVNPDLSWIGNFDPLSGAVRPPEGGVRASGLSAQLILLLDILGKLFPELEASVDLKYGSSEELWKRGISNYGGYLTLILRDGKVSEDDLPII